MQRGITFEDVPNQGKTRMSAKLLVWFFAAIKNVFDQNGHIGVMLRCKLNKSADIGCIDMCGKAILITF